MNFRKRLGLGMLIIGCTCWLALLITGEPFVIRMIFTTMAGIGFMLFVGYSNE